MLGWASIIFAGLMAGQSVQSYALPVYSNINNPWPSLNLARIDLEKNLIELRPTPWVEVKGEGPLGFWLREESLLNPTHVSKWALLKDPTRLKGPWLIHQHQAHKTQISLPHSLNKSGQKYWVDNSQLTALGVGWDFALTKKSTSLFAHADFSGKNLCPIKIHERLPLISFSGHFAKVKACGGVGFVPLKDLVTKVNFAKSILTSEGPHEILAVNVSEIIDINHRPISFSSIVGFEFHPGVRLRESQSTQKLYVVQTKNIIWGLSELPRAGKFWWNTGQKETAPQPETTTRDLLKRKLFDIVSSPVNPSEKWASAHGIFRTSNGKTWQKIDQFENNDFPIHINSSGRILVGPYFSDDDGQTFSSYVRWDLLLKILNQNYHAHLSDIRLSQILPLDITGDALKLVFNIANQYLSVETRDFGTSWQLIKK